MSFPLLPLATAVLLASLAATPSLAGDLVEPALRVPAGLPDGPEVALTFDACTGDVDHRILDTLVEHRIAATIFVTGRWLKRNAAAMDTLLAHPDLFEIEDHGLNHVPAVLGAEKPYGLTPAGTIDAVLREVDGGAKLVKAATGRTPHWYRDATALYSPAAMDAITADHFRIAGFTLNADYGASLPAPKAEIRILSAADGDVIIAHINQPNRASGAGIARGLVELQKKGFHFVKLSDALPE